MDDDLEEVKEQLDQLSETLDRMQDHTDSDTRPDDHETHSTDAATDKDREEPLTASRTDGDDSNTPGDQDEVTVQDETTDSEDPHPTDIGRFRDKLDHGHEAANQDHLREAQRIYRSLIQEYRGLKHSGDLTDEDESRLHSLYEKVNKAKE